MGHVKCLPFSSSSSSSSNSNQLHVCRGQQTRYLRTLGPFNAGAGEASRPNQLPTLLVRRLRTVAVRAMLSRIWFMMPLKLSTSGLSRSNGSDCLSSRLVLVGGPPVRGPGVIARVSNTLAAERLAPGLLGRPGPKTVVPGRLGPGSPKKVKAESRVAGKAE